jgi:2'-hydroxyisoflavone reductase
VRVALGGDVLAPGSPTLRVQFIDGRDLAEWTVQSAEAQHTGIFNATGPAAPLTMGELLEACKTVTNSSATFTWVEDDFLVEHDLAPYSDLPLWIPEHYNGIQSVNIQKALAAGLRFRPLADTVRDTWKWNMTRSGAESKAPNLRAGIMLDREVELLTAWKQRT